MIGNIGVSRFARSISQQKLRVGLHAGHMELEVTEQAFVALQTH